MELLIVLEVGRRLEWHMRRGELLRLMMRLLLKRRVEGLPLLLLRELSRGSATLQWRQVLRDTAAVPVTMSMAQVGHPRDPGHSWHGRRLHSVAGPHPSNTAHTAIPLPVVHPPGRVVEGQVHGVPLSLLHLLHLYPSHVVCPLARLGHHLRSLHVLARQIWVRTVLGHHRSALSTATDTRRTAHATNAAAKAVRLRPMRPLR